VAKLGDEFGAIPAGLPFSAEKGPDKAISPTACAQQAEKGFLDKG
jgi:hypothetical protein